MMTVFLTPDGQKIELTNLEKYFLEQNIKDRAHWPFHLSWMRFRNAFALPNPNSEEQAKKIAKVWNIRSHAYIEGWNAATMFKSKMVLKQNGPPATKKKKPKSGLILPDSPKIIS